MKPRTQAALDWLKAEFPLVFDPHDPKPLAIGIGRGIQALAGAMQPEGVSKAGVRSALHHWTTTAAYRAALAAGGERFDLDGKAVGKVSGKHRKEAKS